MNLMNFDDFRIIATFDQNNIAWIDCFVFVKNDYDHFVIRKKIDSTSICFCFHDQFYLRIQNDSQIIIKNKINL